MSGEDDYGEGKEGGVGGGKGLVWLLCEGWAVELLSVMPSPGSRKRPGRGAAGGANGPRLDLEPRNGSSSGLAFRYLGRTLSRLVKLSSGSLGVVRHTAETGG